MKILYDIYNDRIILVLYRIKDKIQRWKGENKMRILEKEKDKRELHTCLRWPTQRESSCI